VVQPRTADVPFCGGSHEHAEGLDKKTFRCEDANRINVIKQVGDKLVRITLDPSGQRIISAGYIQARNVANSIASGRFIPQ